jgi:DNA-binding transcriptional regulator PaaX
MGKLEKESKKRARKENIQKATLATIKAVGLMSMALVAPNILKSLSVLSGSKSKKSYKINRSMNRLLARNLIKMEKMDRGTFVRLTLRGEHLLQRLYEKDGLQKPKRWDGKWRIVIYDLKEHRKILRDKLRRTLLGFGFVKLQYSVWVYPYDCEDLITLVKADFKIGKEVLYIIADSIENDVHLKDLFGISRLS